MTRFLGIDLAWGSGTAARHPKETGVAVIEEDGQVLDAGWALGVEEVRHRARRWSTPGAVIAVDAPLVMASHPATRELIGTPSPMNDRAYKHREDLPGAVLCAWTAALWAVGGLARVQILGADDIPDADGRIPTIVAPARPAQRRENSLRRPCSRVRSRRRVEPRLTPR